MNVKKSSIFSIDFVPLSQKHFDLLRKWLATDFVSHWYKVKDLTEEGIHSKYNPVVSGAEPIDAYVFMNKDKASGYVQTYWYSDFPPHDLQVELPPKAAGLDIYIGEELDAGNGLGRAVMQKFLKDIVFGKKRAKFCIVDPDQENKRAISAYKSVGFKDWQAKDSTRYLLVSAEFFHLGQDE